MRKEGPKKILTCDGGGIRGLISVEILAKLEADLRIKLGQPELLLGDYFDFICGTSTGGIIAACLSSGMSVSQIRDFYVSNGSSMFERAKWYMQLHQKYEAEPLALLLQQALTCQLNGPGSIYNENDPPVELGDLRMRGLLMLVLRNHNTDSPWPVCNNPLAKYNQLDRKDCNLHLPLWQLVRASTAAPTFFPPEVVTFAAGTNREYQFVFVDGGITTYNNPAYLAFQMATASPYKINWTTGVDQMLIVSVGTGNAPAARPDFRPEELSRLGLAITVPSALMNAATAGWDMVCRVLGECRYGGEVDREFGAMIQAPNTPAGESNWSGLKQFAYVRYDPLTSREGLNDLDLPDVSDKAMAGMDDVKLIPELQRVGEAYAGRHVKIDHLAGFV
ncbi:patatin-like phospholipase family protein [Synechococcus sp. Tobar12-5m-g]|uniref:patatin-like phospholipase family protein n=1 Tax=unclassified Synechococcus TaxID=2626047 RepID=UPI0020CC8EFD|nr:MULTISPECIES: patatin-like phospholipase family protein [unclassified Synechococcus]MCP9772314.1 patatin-like phospholipase family protein [Synechococcus sp. Tobar12-5m-g]MCP9873256.1 patatin-like phospholipase family protein [Synechococcus sp. Cruz CV-v-12]